MSLAYGACDTEVLSLRTAPDRDSDPATSMPSLRSPWRRSKHACRKTFLSRRRLLSRSLR
eukprot:7053958-Prymnesium_polylepis.1